MSNRMALAQYVRQETEAHFQQSVTELAERCGWLWWHDNDSRRNRRGFPDLVLLRAPRLLLVELKTERGKLRPEQRIWLDELGQCPGIETYVWRPGDFDEIVSILNRRQP